MQACLQGGYMHALCAQLATLITLCFCQAETPPARPHKELQRIERPTTPPDKDGNKKENKGKKDEKRRPLWPEYENA
jgi:hypothetical protein